MASAKVAPQLRHLMDDDIENRRLRPNAVFSGLRPTVFG